MTSYGLVSFFSVMGAKRRQECNEDNEEITEDQLYYHLCQRRDSYAYITFIKGKMSEDEYSQYIPLMTIEEIQRIFSYPFDLLWKDLFIYSNNHDEFSRAKTKFESCIDSFKLACNAVSNVAKEQEWEIPKGGKKNQNEPPLVCALREYREETLNKSYQDILDVYPEVVEYQGTNGKKYTSVFFISESRYKVAPKYNFTENHFRRRCVSIETQNVTWATLEECKELLHPRLYNIIENINRLLKSSYNSIKKISLRDGASKYLTV